MCKRCGQRDFTGQRVGRGHNYFVSSPLGSGADGNVYRAADLTISERPTFAIKCARECSSPSTRTQQIAEIYNQKAVARCPNVLQIWDAFGQDGYTFIVLPLCKNDMYAAIWEQGVYWKNDSLIKRAFLEILKGVSACHRSGVFHRDLKPENLMCDENGVNIQIADFGSSTNRLICIDDPGRCGTAAYVAPECWEGDGAPYRADKVDIWSLGIVLFNMVISEDPWKKARLTDDSFHAYIYYHEEYFLLQYPISASLHELLCGILHPIPEMRMSIQAIQQAIVNIETFYTVPVHTLQSS